MSSSKENDSLLISKALDCMGYSLDCIQLKRELFKKKFEREEDEYQVQLILAGSKAEGISNPLESDVDIMKCVNSCKCSEDLRLIQNNRFVEKFYLDRKHAPSGYTLVEYAGKGFSGPVSKARNICEKMLRLASFPNKRGRLSLSSDVFITVAQKTFNSNLTLCRSGPAVSFDQQNNIFPELNLTTSYDYVFAIPLHSPNLLRQWKNRQRPYDWPPAELQETISNMNGHIVPVGYKLSDTQDREWRICFTPAEKLLVFSFNETQLKLYVLMKIVVKALLKPVCSEITSYVVKNLIFWIVEKLPPDVFRLTSLANLLMITLRVLNEAVVQKQLPNYMIMGRNLFSGRLEGERRLKLLERLSQLLNIGPAFLNEIPEMGKLRSTLLMVYKNPTEAQRVKRAHTFILQSNQKLLQGNISPGVATGFRDLFNCFLATYSDVFDRDLREFACLPTEERHTLLDSFLGQPENIYLIKTFIFQMCAKFLPDNLNWLEEIIRSDVFLDALNVICNFLLVYGDRDVPCLLDAIKRGFYHFLQ